MPSTSRHPPRHLPTHAADAGASCSMIPRSEDSLTLPRARAATRPAGSITRVDGIAWGGSESANSSCRRPSRSTMLGYGTPKRSTNARAETSESRVSSPANCTPRPSNSSASATSAGASARHGAHQEAHTLRTTASPRWSLSRNVPPSSVSPTRSGAGGRWSSGRITIDPSPATKPLSAAGSAASVDDPQPASSSVRATAATAAIRVSMRALRLRRPCSPWRAGLATARCR